MSLPSKNTPQLIEPTTCSSWYYFLKHSQCVSSGWGWFRPGSCDTGVDACVASLLWTRWVGGFFCWLRPVEPDLKLAVLHSGRLRCALQLTWPRSVQPHFSFLDFYVYLLLGDIKGGAKDSKAQTLISTLCVLLLLAVPSWGQGSARWRRSTSGANQEQMDRVMTPSPLEQQCNCHSKSQHVGLCTSVDLCVRRWWAGLGGHVMALRVPLIWVTDTPPTSVLWKILSFSPMSSLTVPFHCAPQ